jgi:diguanylate cyclase (GGDEF)-like protein
MILSRQLADVVTPRNERLIQWSAEVLAQTLRRIYCDAAIRRQARHDGLTDLANRRTFDTLLVGEVDRVQLGLSEECSLLLADLDRFKSINDRYGHQTGDEVLRLTARLLREQMGKMRVGERSLLARYGGEELAILLPGVGTAGALRIAEEIRAAVERMTVAFGENRLGVTVSIGVATCPRHGLKAADLLSATDAGLYRAKSEGRNRVCLPPD